MPYIWTAGDSDGEIRLSLLRRAVELDPGYALAHSLISWVHSGRVHYGKGDYDNRNSDGAEIGETGDRA